LKYFPETPFNRPFMIGICQGQTELSSPVPPDGAVVSPHSLTGRAQCALSRERIYISVQFVFRLRVFDRLGSTAKRDQSFICAYPALRGGLHGRLSLGNPPALKQSVWVHREAGLPRTGRYQQGPAGTRVSRIETAISSHAPGAPLAPHRIHSISSFDSWSGCPPLGTTTLVSETLPDNRAASCWLARRPASSPSSITTSC